MADATRSVDMKIVSAKEAELENHDEEETKQAAPGELPKMTL